MFTSDHQIWAIQSPEGCTLGDRAVISHNGANIYWVLAKWQHLYLHRLISFHYNLRKEVLFIYSFTDKKHKVQTCEVTLLVSLSWWVTGPNQNLDLIPNANRVGIISILQMSELEMLTNLASSYINSDEQWCLDLNSCLLLSKTYGFNYCQLFKKILIHFYYF